MCFAHLSNRLHARKFGIDVNNCQMFVFGYGICVLYTDDKHTLPVPILNISLFIQVNFGFSKQKSKDSIENLKRKKIAEKKFGMDEINQLNQSKIKADILVEQI